MDSKKVILAEWDDNLRSLYSLNLSTYVNAEVVLAQSYKDIISKLKEAPGTALIITRAMQNGDKTAINLVEHLGPKNKIPILVIGVEPALEGRTDFLKPNCEIKDLIKKVAHHLGVTAEKMSSLLVPDYYPIDSNFFLHLSEIGRAHV